MRQERVAKARWQTLNTAEKIFTLFILSSFLSGFVLLVLEASKKLGPTGISG